MRAFRLLLLLCPASFRHEYGDEMERIVARRRREAEGPLAIPGVWLSAVADVLATAARVHADILRQDLRHTARALWRAPAFTLTAIVVTALGVGATTAAFTLTDHVLFRRLPFPDADRLVKIYEGEINRDPGLRGMAGTNDVSPANYLSWKEMSRSFAVMSAYAFSSSNLVGGGDPERLDGVSVTADIFDVLGVSPAIGRAFRPEDDRTGAPCVIVISDGLWRRRFGGDPSVLTTRVRLDEETCTISGVMPRGFDFPLRTTTFWRPVRFRADVSEDRADHYMRAIARLKPDVSLEQARAELRAVSLRLAQMFPKDNADVGTVVIRLRDELTDQSRMMLLALAGAAACVLLIACTNLASLLVARAAVRGRELAVRTALGAGRERLVRQLFTESLALAFIGGSLGMLVALAALPTAIRLVPTALPIAEAPPIDLRMLATAALVTLATGIGFGVLPAFRAARLADHSQLRDGARTVSDRRTERLRAGLVVAQITISIVLLTSAGLLIRALLRVQSVSPGFNTTGVLTMRTMLPMPKYALQAPRAAFYREVIEGVKTLPGVTAAAYTSYLPMTMRGGIWGVVVPGRRQDPDQSASARFVTPEYFRAMEIPLVQGRAFRDSDTLDAQPVAIVSQEFVRQYLDGRMPVGRTFQFGPAGDRTIVGVVGEVRVRGLERSSEPQVYMAYQQQADNSTIGYVPKDLIVRMDAERAQTAQLNALVPAIRGIVARADRDLAIADVRPLAAIVEGESAVRTVQVRVLGSFAALACLLAAVGLHGLLAFIVSARTREFGVRLALGAEPREILSLVARHGIVLGLVGIALGVGAAYLAGRSLQSLLFGVSPADPVTIAAAVGVSIAMTLAGSLVPAARAARTNPTEAIRTE